jgi:hypothetical protein
MRVRRWVRGTALAAVLAAGCSNGGGGTTPSPTATHVAVEVPLSDLSLTLPEHVSLAASIAAPSGGVTGLSLFGDWLTWNDVPATAATTAATTAAASGRTQPTETVATNLRTGERIVVAGHAPGVVTTLSVGTGDVLVQRETTPRPKSDCAPGAPDCWEWAIYSRDLRTGADRLLARSTAPRPQDHNPIVVAGSGRAAWQQFDAGEHVVTVVADLATGTLTTVQRDVPSSQLSIFGDALYLDHGRAKEPTLLRVPLTGGTAAVRHLPRFYRPRVAAGIVSWIAGEPTKSMTVQVEPAGTQAGPTDVFTSNEVYEAFPLGPGATAVVDFEGLSLSIGTTPTQITVVNDPAARVAADGARFVFQVLDRNDKPVVVVLDVMDALRPTP